MRKNLTQSISPYLARQHSLPIGIHLTNRFHVAVRLFSNRSQMTSKCGKNKKVSHEAIVECVTDGYGSQSENDVGDRTLVDLY